MLFLAFEDIEQLKQRDLNKDVFRLYTNDEVLHLLVNAGFSNDVNIVLRVKGKSLFHCVVAINNSILVVLRAKPGSLYISSDSLIFFEWSASPNQNEDTFERKRYQAIAQFRRISVNIFPTYYLSDIFFSAIVANPYYFTIPETFCLLTKAHITIFIGTEGFKSDTDHEL